jgi:hypothetical protein
MPYLVQPESSTDEGGIEPPAGRISGGGVRFEAATAGQP